jgi:hypothetical protein
MENTPRNVVIQVGSLIALYLSASFLLTLVFGLINISYPSPADNYWEIENATDNIRLGIAMVIVFFPTYLFLVRLMNRYRRTEDVALYQHITKWLIYLSLLIGGFVLLGTLVTTIYTFLDGDLTTRFILKAVAVVGVVGTAVYYYTLDARGYWIKAENKSIVFAASVSLIVLTAITFGLMNIETPTIVREMKTDVEQINDLREIQAEINAYLVYGHLNTKSSTTTDVLDSQVMNQSPENLQKVLTYKGTLPLTLIEAYKNSGRTVPTAPLGREPYTYEVTEKGFNLCATFIKDSVETDSYPMGPIDETARIINSEDWSYKAGRYCFERVVN